MCGKANVQAGCNQSYISGLEILESGDLEPMAACPTTNPTVTDRAGWMPIFLLPDYLRSPKAAIIER